MIRRWLAKAISIPWGFFRCRMASLAAGGRMMQKSLKTDLLDVFSDPTTGSWSYLPYLAYFSAFLQRRERWRYSRVVSVPGPPSVSSVSSNWLPRIRTHTTATGTIRSELDVGYTRPQDLALACEQRNSAIQILEWNSTIPDTRLYR